MTDDVIAALGRLCDQAIHTAGGAEGKANVKKDYALVLSSLPTEIEWGVEHRNRRSFQRVFAESDLELYGEVWIPKTRNVTPWKDAS